MDHATAAFTLNFPADCGNINLTDGWPGAMPTPGTGAMPTLAWACWKLLANDTKPTNRAYQIGQTGANGYDVTN